MRIALRTPLNDVALVNLAAAGFLLFALLCATFTPTLFGLLLAAGAASGVIFLAFRFTPAFTAAWLVVTGASLEMTAVDLLGADAYQPTVALIKAIGLGLAIVAALRYGPRIDPFNPAFAWLAMFVGGMTHGLWPGLTLGESARSLIGSIAPFAFGFSRLSRGWAHAIIRAACWAPVASVTGGMIAAAIGYGRYSSTAVGSAWPAWVIRRSWPGSAKPRSMPACSNCIAMAVAATFACSGSTCCCCC